MPIPKHGKILVTGGAGFIGSALVWALNARGYENILVCDRLGTGEKWKNLVALRYADYVDADDLLERLEKKPSAFGPITTVLHMGACSATTEKDAGFLMRNNFQYTKDLCQWAMEHRARFFYASSAATYGDGAQGMEDSGEDLGRFRPLNMYGYSKQLFDVYAQKAGILSQIFGLKFFNIFGPNENHKGEMRSVVHKAYQQISTTGKVSLFKSYHPDYPDGGQRRDFLYVKDAVEMVLHLSDKPLSGGLYNIGSGKAHTWIDLVTPIFQALGLAPQIDFVDMPETMRKKYQYFTQADVRKLAQTAYPGPLTPLPEAVMDYVTHYLKAGAFLGE